MQKQNIGLERPGLPFEVARVAGFLASGFSSYVTGKNSFSHGSTRASNTGRTWTYTLMYDRC